MFLLIKINSCFLRYINTNICEHMFFYRECVNICLFMKFNASELRIYE